MPYIGESMQTVVELPEFIQCAKKIKISETERTDIVDEIADNPMMGDEIAGTGGMRKVRFAANGKGKSGGYRVITFFTGTNIPVFLVTVYPKSGKGAKSNITEQAKNAMKGLSSSIVEAYRSNKND